VAASLADVDRHPQSLVARVLDRLDLALAHRHDSPVDSLASQEASVAPSERANASASCANSRRRSSEIEKTVMRSQALARRGRPEHRPTGMCWVS